MAEIIHLVIQLVIQVENDVAERVETIADDACHQIDNRLSQFDIVQFIGAEELLSSFVV
ncbi:hypothetical protein [Leptolyngbya ohadii]|uniref:hypothetical protein n=1 Tax=Leptolyngbya ohadii TaxID=1962290 RepID=UPI0015C5B006|nr:hypothetical protein [Leptolyngbya ohadii]